MKIKVLGSSSHGNCYALETGTEVLLLECGLRFQDIRKSLNFDFSRVTGCLITHEHKDHSKAVQEIMKSGIDVYASYGTFDSLKLDGHRGHPVKALQQFEVGGLTILPFETQHDATEPLGFLIYHPGTGEKLLYATDTYYVRNRFGGLNYIMVECNYCLETLRENVESGLVPPSLKDRILGSHFSLDHVKEFLQANVTTDTRKIVLIHLSDDNSDAARMQREVEELTGVETVIADSGMEIDLELYPF